MELTTQAIDSAPALAQPENDNSSEPRRSAEGIVRSQTSQAEAETDRLLIARFNNGDESAFNELVSRHRSRIHALAERFLRNYADAEEIVQDTFLRVYRGLATFRGDASFATWVHRIALNLSRNRYGYYFRRRRHLTLSLETPLSPDSDTTFTDRIGSTSADPARQATVDEFVVLVDTCMERLHPGHREILTMRNQLHYSYDEIARTLGITEGTVKSRIARARGCLRGLMADACPEFRDLDVEVEWFETPTRSGPGIENAA